MELVAGIVVRLIVSQIDGVHETLRQLDSRWLMKQGVREIWLNGPAVPARVEDLAAGVLSPSTAVV